jgi:phospholipid-translocating ATPase
MDDQEDEASGSGTPIPGGRAGRYGRKGKKRLSDVDAEEEEGLLGTAPWREDGEDASGSIRPREEPRDRHPGSRPPVARDKSRTIPLRSSRKLAITMG